MPHLPDFRFSAQSLQTYQDCPRRFYLRYIQKLDWPAVESIPYLAFEEYRQKGELFHSYTNQYFKGIAPQDIEKQIKVDNLKQWWSSFLEFIRKQTFSHTSSEVLFQSSLGNHILVAKFDLLAMHPDGKFTIFDWKTTSGKNRPGREKLSKKMQTKLYPYIFGSIGITFDKREVIPPTKVKLEYWFPQFPDGSEAFPYSTNQMQNDEVTLLKLMDEIGMNEMDDFVETTDEEPCRFCVYRSYCGRGTQAGNILLEKQDADLDLGLGDVDYDFENIEEIAY
jgi:hypothetical protein